MLIFYLICLLFPCSLSAFHEDKNLGYRRGNFLKIAWYLFDQIFCQNAEETVYFCTFLLDVKLMY